MAEKIMIQVDDKIIEATGDVLQSILDAQAEQPIVGI